MTLTQFIIHFAIDGYLGYFQLRAIMINTVMNIIPPILRRHIYALLGHRGAVCESCAFSPSMVFSAFFILDILLMYVGLSHCGFNFHFPNA